MAVRKRLGEPVRVVAVMADDGLDLSMDVEQYCATRDPELVRVAPGQTVTWWTLRPLGASQVASIRAQPESLARLLAFAASLDAVDDATIASALRWETQRGERHVSIESLDQVVPDTVVDELGQLALDLGTPTSGEGRRFAAPHGLRAIQTRLRGTSVSTASGSEATHPDESC